MTALDDETDSWPSIGDVPALHLGRVNGGVVGSDFLFEVGILDHTDSPRGVDQHDLGASKYPAVCSEADG